LLRGVREWRFSVETAAIRVKAPGFIEPALATSIEKVPSGGRRIHEIKFDGYRVEVHSVNEAVTVFTRRGHDWTQRFKKVAHDAWRIRASSALVDGGIVVPAADGTTDFSVLQNELKGSSKPIGRRRSQAPVGPDGPFGEHADLTADLGDTQTNGESHPQVESRKPRKIDRGPRTKRRNERRHSHMNASRSAAIANGKGKNPPGRRSAIAGSRRVTKVQGASNRAKIAHEAK
jgi:hypothetical protein